MSTEHHNFAGGNGRPQHADVSFEGEDVQPSPILKFIWWLGVTVVLSFVLCLGIYEGLIRYWTSTYDQPSPMRPAGAEYPPEPRLQGMAGHLKDPQQDMRDKVKADNRENEKLGWLDQKSGIAQIPVSDAMKIILEKGLPAVHPVVEEKK
jgi:hypothetical protein